MILYYFLKTYQHSIEWIKENYLSVIKETVRAKGIRLDILYRLRRKPYLY
jgi:hypothetical protein